MIHKFVFQKKMYIAFLQDPPLKKGEKHLYCEGWVTIYGNKRPMQ